VNDSLYEPLAGLTLDILDQEGKEEELDEAVGRAHVPKKPIGLQAAGILFGGIKARASAPWWHG